VDTDVDSDMAASSVENCGSTQRSVMAGEEQEWDPRNSRRVGTGTREREWAWTERRRGGGAGRCGRRDFSRFGRGRD
jgi:hypothetical protein